MVKQEIESFSQGPSLHITLAHNGLQWTVRVSDSTPEIIGGNIASVTDGRSRCLSGGLVAKAPRLKKLVPLHLVGARRGRPTKRRETHGH